MLWEAEDTLWCKQCTQNRYLDPTRAWPGTGWAPAPRELPRDVRLCCKQCTRNRYLDSAGSPELPPVSAVL
jgi:ribosomal protein L33